MEEEGDGMTQDECENLLNAYEQVVLLAENDVVMECSDLAARIDSAKDSLGAFIASLLYESSIGDGRASHDEAR
jgi:hypothetical protein